MIVVSDLVGVRRARVEDDVVLDRLQHDADAYLGAAHGLDVASAEERSGLRRTDRVTDRFVFLGLPDLDVVGSASVYDRDDRNRTAWMTLRSSAASRHSGLAMAGAGVCLCLGFREMGLRVMYAQVTSHTLGWFRSIVDDGTATIEARFADGMVHPDGSTYDLYWLAIERDRWMREWGRLVLSEMVERSEGSVVAESRAGADGRVGR